MCVCVCVRVCVCACVCVWFACRSGDACLSDLLNVPFKCSILGLPVSARVFSGCPFIGLLGLPVNRPLYVGMPVYRPLCQASRL